MTTLEEPPEQSQALSRGIGRSGQRASRPRALAPSRLGAELVSLAAVTWDFPLVGRTRMLGEAWEASGRHSTFVQIPSLRTAIQRLGLPERSAAYGEGPRPAVIRPWPSYPASLWTRLPQHHLERSIARSAARLRAQLDPLIDWRRSVAIAVTPAWLPWLTALPFARIIYDCIDNLTVMTPRPSLLPLHREWERRLIERADAVVCSATPLADRIRADHRDVPLRVIRNGVDVAAMRAGALTQPAPALPRLRSESPRVGFVGALYEWIDWELIRAVAESRPELEFLFIGPMGETGLPAWTRHLANVHFLGPCPYWQVPAYLREFDACWVPFAAGEISRDANPIKIYEYLSLGKPVVSTPVADPQAYGDFVGFATTPADVASALDEALIDSEEAREARLDFARSNDWGERAREYTDFADEVLAAPARRTRGSDGLR